MIDEKRFMNKVLQEDCDQRKRLRNLGQLPGDVRRLAQSKGSVRDWNRGTVSVGPANKGRSCSVAEKAEHEQRLRAEGRMNPGPIGRQSKMRKRKCWHDKSWMF